MNKLNDVIKHFGERTQTMLRSFPVTLSLLTILTVMLCVYVIAGKDLFTSLDSARWVVVSIYYLTVMVMLDFGLSLWMEELKNKRIGIITKIAVYTIWTAYCIWLTCADIEFEHMSVAFILNNAAWIVAFSLLIPFISFWREKDDVKAWHMIISLLLADVISSVIVWVMMMGGGGLVFGIMALFKVSPPEEFTICCAIACSVLLGGFLFLCLTPSGEKKHNTDTYVYPFLSSVMKWLILPLSGCYVVVLYVYMCSIIVRWELPHGTISMLVSVVMLGYVFTYVVLYPRIKNGQDKLSVLLKKWAPVIILPLLVLMTVGIGRRIYDYGITAPRLYLLTLNIWYYAICVVIAYMPRKRFHWIFLSFAALLLLSSGLPVNYYSISERYIVHRIERILEENHIAPQPNRGALRQALNEAIGIEETDRIMDDISYLRETYHSEKAREWIGDPKTNRAKDEAESDSENAIEEAENISWKEVVHFQAYNEQTCKHKEMVFSCPQGEYKTFRKIHVYSYAPTIVPLEKVEGDIIPVVWNPSEDSLVIRMNIKDLQNAEKDQSTLILPVTTRHASKTNQADAAFVAEEVKLLLYPDSQYTVSYEGFLFEK